MQNRAYLSGGYIRPIARGHPFHGVYCSRSVGEGLRAGPYPLHPYTPFLRQSALPSSTHSFSFPAEQQPLNFKLCNDRATATGNEKPRDRGVEEEAEPGIFKWAYYLGSSYSNSQATS